MQNNDLKFSITLLLKDLFSSPVKKVVDSLKDTLAQSEKTGQSIKSSFTAPNTTGITNSLKNINNSLKETQQQSKKTSASVNILEGSFASLIATGAGLITMGVIFKKALDAEEQTAKLSSQLGRSKAEILNFGQIAKNIFKSGIGESIDEINRSVGKTTQFMERVGAVSNKEIEQVTAKTLTLSNVFESNFEKNIDSVATLMEHFGLTAEQALDFLAAGFQRGLNRSDDFHDSIREYATQFASGGATAEQFFSVMETGLESGVMGTDKAADAFKEFRIRIQDGSTATNDGLQLLGFNTDEFVGKLESGETTVAQAFQTILKKLNETENSSIRLQAGVGLIGTQYEDLGNTALKIDLGQTKMEDLTGAASKLNVVHETLNARIQVAIRSFFSQATASDSVRLALDIMRLSVEKFIEHLDKIVMLLDYAAKAFLVLASIKIAGWFAAGAAAVSAMSAQLILLTRNAGLALLSLRGLTVLQLVTWFTSGATGALALASALGKITLILAAGFAVYKIAELAKVLYDLYSVRKLQREAEESLASSTAKNNARLSEMSKQLGIAIPNMKAFQKLFREGVIVPDNANGWTLAATQANNYAKEIKKIETEIAQKSTETAKQKTELQKIELNASKASLSEMLAGRIQFDNQVIASAKLTTDELVKLEAQAADKIKALKKSIVDEQLSLEDKIRELKRRGMDDSEQQADIELQIQEKLKAAKEALGAGDTNQATELANQVKSLANSITDTDKAIASLENGSKVVQDAMQQQIEQTQKFKDELQKQEGSELQIKANITQAESEIEALKIKLAELKDKTVTITTKQVEGHNAGGVVGLARGGNVPGVGNTDTIPAMLTPGEFVVKKARALQFGELLNLINYAPFETLKKAFEPIKLNMGGIVGPRISLAIPEVPKLAFAGGGSVPSVSAIPVETINLNWKIGERSGSLETLMGQRQQLSEFVRAVQETGKYL